MPIPSSRPAPASASPWSATARPDFEGAYRLADISLYDAKAAGGSAYRVADAVHRPGTASHSRQKTVSALLAAVGVEPADQAACDGEKAADERHG